MYILSIIGSSHSGSTILARWLSQLEDAIALGETRAYFRGKLLTKSPEVWTCSCGKSLNSCPVWSKKPKNEDELRYIIEESIIIDSSKAKKGDFNVFIYKNPLQLARSAKSVLYFFQLLRQTVKSWLIARNTWHLSFSYSYFTEYPEEVIKKVAKELGAGIDWNENSHIVYSNKSKYSPLAIEKK